MPVVFISHASADKPLVDGLFNLLQTGCDLRLDDVACTSVEDAGIRTGDDFIGWIGDHLADSSIVLLVLSPNYYASTFCTAEMGAAWALGKRIYPLMLPGIGRDPGVVFLGRQSAALNETGLDNLRDAIAEHHEGASRATARWNIQRDAFLADVGRIVETLPAPNLVPREALDEQVERADAAVELYREAEEEKRVLAQRVSALEKLKDADQVAEVSREFDSSLQRYEAAVAGLREELKELNRVEQRAVYAYVRREFWYPGRETWDYWTSDIEKAARSEWLDEQTDMNDHTYYQLNESHPRYSGVVEAIRDLEQAIESLEFEAIQQLQDEGGYLVSIDNQEYWEEALLKHGLLE